MPQEIFIPEILPIVCYNASILREVSTPAENTQETQNLVANMLHTMTSINSAVGLAANQVNSTLSVFVMRPNRKNIVVINPIIRKRRGSVKSTESCLSLPGISETILRDEIIEVEYHDLNFNKQKMSLRGFEAIVFQHEFCHLQGILFIDFLTPKGKDKIAYRLAEMESGLIDVKYHVLPPILK